MCNKEAQKQSKRVEIDEILQQVENYANEGRVGAEELNIVLLQKRVPTPDVKKLGSAALSPDESSLGWFDSLIKRLLKVKNNLEKTSVSISMLHKEITGK